MIDFDNLPAQDKIYYQDKKAGIVIYCADNKEILPLLPDKSVDLVLTDPPYNAKNIGPNEREYVGTVMCLPEAEYRGFCRDWFSKVTAENIVFTPGISNICNYPQPYWALCWHKPAAVSFNRMGGFNTWEPIFCYGKPFKKLPQDYLLFNTMNFTKGVERDHPCPKPVALWQYLINLTEAETILDPFLGSGTTAYCAKKLGRKCIGIEISEKYCQIAVERLRQATLPFEFEQVEQRHGTSEPLMFGGMTPITKSHKITSEMGIGNINKETDRE